MARTDKRSNAAKGSGCCSEAIEFASDKADSAGETARKAVRARPLTTAVLSISAGAILGALLAR